MLKNARRIDWKTWEPATDEEFPCMNCKKAKATHQADYLYKGKALLHIVLCEECSKKEDLEL